MNQPTAIKIVLLGKLGVGKSGSIYRHCVQVDQEKVNIEILDSGGEDCVGTKDSSLLWGDAFILVYAINDRESFSKIPMIKQRIEEIRSHDRPFLAIVGNKRDLENERQIQNNEAEANLTPNCIACEISTLQSFEEVQDVFVRITKQVLKEKRGKMAASKTMPYKKIKGMMDKHISRTRAMSSLRETIDEYYVVRSNEQELHDSRDRSDTCEF